MHFLTSLARPIGRVAAISAENAAMLDHAQDSQEALERADKIVEMIVLEMAVFGGVLFALVVFGIIKGLIC